MTGKHKILNDDIKADKVQLITDEGENLGEMSLDEAKQKAKENSLDLMLMGNNKDVSIVKMLDYGKYLYRQKKQEQKNKQKGKAPDLKNIRISFRIGEHDLEVKRKQAEKFAKDGSALKISLMLRGRENHYSDMAFEKMESFVQSLEDIYRLDGKIKKSGNTFSAMLKPNK